MIPLVSKLKPIDFKNIMVTAIVSVMLSACSHNAPAPVFDATLSQRVVKGLKQSRQSSIHPAPTNRTTTNRTTTSKTTSANQANFQPNSSAREAGTAILNVPTSETIREAEHKVSGRLQQHRVKAGETLYSIAWQYSLDPTDLARINGIQSGAIFPNQLLALKATKGVKASGVYNKAALIASLDREILSQRLAPSKPKQANAKHQTKRQAMLLASTSKPSVNPPFAVNDSVKRWLWPVNGKVIRPFSNRSNSNKGVDIAAKHGASVRATANGKVVYSGSGLRGYGQLVIIKHNELFLSAYAHNDKIHVKENEFVKAGQKIANLGKSDSNEDKLHFEIRYKGKPVDPLNYLPKSG